MQDKIFINCPYDESYKELFFALIYICELYNYDPIFAACDETSGDRMTNIISCMEESKFAVHDISKIHELIPRFNMPFELGMYYMHIHEKDNSKKMLILEGENNKSDLTLSDLSGSEIKCHSNKIEGIFSSVRPFLNQIGFKKDESAKKMYREYILNCLKEINKKSMDNGYENYLELDFLEFKRYICDYLKL